MGAILVIDDQHETVDRLIDLLNRENVAVDYASSSEEAIDMLKDDNGYVAVVCDYDIDEFKGTDILRLISGTRKPKSHELERLIRAHFRQNADYTDFVTSYADAVLVLYSSNANIPRSQIPHGVFSVRKNIPGCEEEIIEYLSDLGVIEECSYDDPASSLLEDF